MQKLKILNIGWANLFHLERVMRWFAEKGHEISIVTNVPKKIEGIKVYSIEKKSDFRPRRERYKELSFNVSWDWLRDLNAVVRLKRVVREISPDIIHSHSLWYPGYLGIYLNFHPFVITVLNGDVLWTKDDVGKNVNFFTKLRTYIGLKKADLITGESQTLIDACIKHGADNKKVHVTGGWGVDLKLFNRNGNKAEIRRELGLPENSKIVLSPRNIPWFYNLDKIVKAIPKIISKIEDVYFVFIWPVPEENKDLINLARLLNVEKFIKFVGYVTHDMVAKYYKASDIMVSVSQYDSGPVALQEAMACERVTVISDLPSVREWIKDGWNGILVDPNNVDQIAYSIIKLLENEKMREIFSERNWKLIREKGDQEYWMAKMEELYYSLIKEAR